VAEPIRPPVAEKDEADYIMSTHSPSRSHRWFRQGKSKAQIAIALFTVLGGAGSANAMRECEAAGFVPGSGHCAALPNSEIFYYDTGPTHGSRGEAIIFVHAASGNADAFKFNLQAFAAAGYRAIAYDRKNVGRSSNTQRDDAIGRGRGSTVQDLEDLANHLGLNRFHLVGVAAGGQVVLQYVAAQDPGRVSSAVLAATLGPPGLSTNEPELAALQRNISLPFEVFCPMSIDNPPPAPLRLISGTSAATVTIPTVRLEHRELGTTFRANDRPGVEDFEAIGANGRHSTSDGCRTTAIGANQPSLAASHPRNPNTFARLSEVITPRTLLVAGTGDIFYSPPAHMKLWGSYIPDVQYVQLDTRHAPQFENPAAFNAALLRFFAGGHPFERLNRKGQR
jgi:pimeloyl-ACP methyl ester carboxylesterase